MKPSSFRVLFVFVALMVASSAVAQETENRDIEGEIRTLWESLQQRPRACSARPFLEMAEIAGEQRGNWGLAIRILDYAKRAFPPGLYPRQAPAKGWADRRTELLEGEKRMATGEREAPAPLPPEFAAIDLELLEDGRAPASSVPPDEQLGFSIVDAFDGTDRYCWVHGFVPRLGIAVGGGAVLWQPTNGLPAGSVALRGYLGSRFLGATLELAMSGSLYPKTEDGALGGVISVEPFLGVAYQSPRPSSLRGLVAGLAAGLAQARRPDAISTEDLTTILALKLDLGWVFSEGGSLALGPELDVTLYPAARAATVQLRLALWFGRWE